MIDLKKTKKAFTLIEVLIDLAVVSIIAAAILAAYSGSFKSMSYAADKIAAVALANEEMETLRNMPYDNLATAHGPIYPPGTITDDKEVVRNGITFKVHTSIYYVDDTFDGNAAGTILGKPTDLYPFDYKKAEITVSLAGHQNYLSRITSNIAAKAAETPTNSGILKLCVVDASGAPVSESRITIGNPNVSPAVDISAVTGNDGCIMVPNLPPDSHNEYHVTATKEGYSTDMTYPRTSQNPNAEYPDLDVLVQQVTSQTLVIDTVSMMKISVVDDNSNPVTNTAVHISGAKEKYFNPTTLKYSNDFTTDSNGQITINNMEFDDYTISVNGWLVRSTSPYQPVGLKAGTTQEVTLKVTHDSALPTIASCSPLSAQIGSTTSLTITGSNYDTGVAVKIVAENGTEINGTNVTVKKGSSLDVDFQLTGATAGKYDIVITNPNGNSVRQVGGLTLTP